MDVTHPYLRTMNRFVSFMALLLWLAIAPARAADTPDDAQLESLAKKIGAQLNGLAALFNGGPAQDVEVRVMVLGAHAVATGGDTPGAKLKIDLRLSGMQLQGGDFAEVNFSVEADLVQAGDLWNCTKAMATPGMIMTRSGPIIDGAPREPFNVTEMVQGALVKIGAAKPAIVILREAITKWVSEHTSLGADSPIGEDMGRATERYLKMGRNVGILLGPGLMKSGKATRVGVFCGQPYFVLYSDAQTKEAGLRPTTVVETTDSINTPRRLPADVEIGTPDFGPAGADFAAGVKGTVKIRALRRLPPADYVLRLSYSAGKQSTSAYCHIGDYITEKETPVEFKFSPAAANTPQPTGPIVIFLDVCEMLPLGNGPPAVETISLTNVMVMDATPAK